MNRTKTSKDNRNVRRLDIWIIDILIDVRSTYIPLLTLFPLVLIPALFTVPASRESSPNLFFCPKKKKI